MHLPRELRHEVREARLNIRIAVRGPFEIDVDAVEILRRDQVDRVRDHGLGGRRVGHDRVENRGGRADGAVRLDDEHHAITRRMRVGDDGGEILAVPAGPAGVVGGDAAVGIEVDAEIGHGRQQGVIPVRVLRQAPVGGESEHFARNATSRCQRVRTKRPHPTLPLKRGRDQSRSGRRQRVGVVLMLRLITRVRTHRRIGSLCCRCHCG